MVVKNPNIVLRNIHEKFYLLDITDNYNDDICNLYELNLSGVMIWNNIEKSIDDILKIMTETINDCVDTDIIKEDIIEFIDFMKMKGFVV